MPIFCYMYDGYKKIRIQKIDIQILLTLYCFCCPVRDIFTQKSADIYTQKISGRIHGENRSTYTQKISEDRRDVTQRQNSADAVRLDNDWTRPWNG